MSQLVEVPCPTCGKVALRYQSQIRWRGARFCSIACRSGAAKARRMGTCKQCGVRYERASQHVGRPDAGKFCSRACYYAWTAADRSRRVELVCPVCGSKFSRPAAWVRKQGSSRHCSRECAGRARVRPESEKSRGPGWRRLAESIRERDGRRCVRCSEPEDDRRRHSVDHIVPWLLVKHAPDIANDPTNLATLCDSCHGVKTMKIEPRLLRGDWLALQEFYDRPTMLAAMGLLNRAGSAP